MNNQSILRDPTAETSPALRARLQPPASLNGLTVALLDIGKARGDEYVDRLQELLDGPRHFLAALQEADQYPHRAGRIAPADRAGVPGSGHRTQ